MSTKPLTAQQYRQLAEATSRFSRLCIDPDVKRQYEQLARLYDEIARRLEPLSWAFRSDAPSAAA